MKKLFLSILPFMAGLFPDKKMDGKAKLELSEEELAKIDAESGKEGLGDAFLQYYNNEYLKASDEANEAFEAFLQEMQVDASGASGEEDEEETEDVVPTGDEKSVANQLKAVVKIAMGQKKTIAQLSADMEKLKGLPEEDAPEAVITINGNKNTPVKHSKTHLFASGNGYDALDRPWNQRAAESKPGELKGATVWDKVNIDKLNADLGAYSRRNANEIMSLLMDGYDVPANWNVINNVQDEYIFSAIVTGSITQGFKKGWLPKNKQRFVPIKNKIFDKQIDVSWEASELKAIEKSWLNMFFNEGSTPYKMSFAGYLIAELLGKARKEDKITIFKGVHFDSELLPEGVPGSFMNAMDGFLKVIDDHKNTSFKVHSIGAPTEANCYDYTKAWVKSLPYDFRVQQGLVLGLSEDWHKAIHNARELKKGTNTDYSAQNTFVDQYPNVRYVVHPQLNGSDFMYITTEDNIGLMVDRPGEENSITIELNKRAIDAFADYKLGVYVKALGAKLDPSDPISFENQVFFCNDVEVLTDVYVPAISDDTTPSVSEHNALKIGKLNTAARNITSLDDVVEGKRYYLFGDSDTNISTVKNGTNIILAAGADFALNKGSLITLIGTADGKVVEYARETAESATAEDKVILAADATTADAGDGTYFITSANTGATAFTNIANAVKDEVYTIEGGSATSSTTIASAGNFLLNGAFTASVGAFLKVVYNGTSFIEVGRG